MFCSKCGGENPENAKFCGECGQSLSIDEIEAEQEIDNIAKVVEIDRAGNSVSNSLKYGIVAASLFIPIIGIIMGMIYILKEEDENLKAVGRMWLFIGLGLAFIYFVGSESYYY